jgi:hypothetical protein
VKVEQYMLLGRSDRKILRTICRYVAMSRTYCLILQKTESAKSNVKSIFIHIDRA